MNAVGWTPTFGGNFEGEYKATMSYTARTGDPNYTGERKGYGLILSGHQDFNSRFGVAARWNKSFERFDAGVRESLAASFTMTGVGRYTDDWISFGCFQATPIDHSATKVEWRFTGELK